MTLPILIDILSFFFFNHFSLKSKHFLIPIYFSFFIYFYLLLIPMRNFFSSFSSFSTLSKPYYQVVFLRHAESTWNKQKRFTGWSDVRLSQTGTFFFNSGIREAAKAGKVLRENGHQFDICFTSLLTRAIQTFNYAADELDCHYIPIIKDWRMNERHYGALEGLNKIETVEKHGK